MQFRDLKEKITRYLLIDIERITIDVPSPNRMRIRIEGASARQCEYIWDCLAPDLPGIDLTVEGGSPANRARWPMIGGPRGVPNTSPFGWGPWVTATALASGGRRSVFWEIAASGLRRA